MADPIIASVILRNMRNTPNFERGEARVPPALRAHLGPGEVVVGTYRDPEAERILVVLTDAAINVIDSEKLVRRIVWSDVVGCESPRKVAGEGVRLETRDGCYQVPIAGTHTRTFAGPHAGQEGQFLDAFNFLMVVRSLVEC